MAVYRVTIDIFFDALVDVNAFKTQVQNVYSKVRNVIDENSTVTVHKCGHDEIPPKPCTETIYSWVKS